ncbi:phosphotransferase family protein [Qaidamihabitans albus]|uniref:phosphotransferase family protein n=1 Tax=Qaidamihabitans albus TaxID=2795733 RepID=UPI0018F21AF8|nr:phosphotransferase family protein [Qaidamihabitans albus]
MGISDCPRERIERRFTERLDEPVHLAHRSIAGEGLSDETAILDFDRPSGEPLRLVVRLFRPGTVARHEVRPERLHRLLTTLSVAGLPVPRPLWFDPDPELFGGPYSVVSWQPGSAVVPWSPEGRAYLAEAGRGPIGDLFVRLLADIHAVDWRALDLGFLGVPGPGRGFAEARVAELERYLRRVRVEPEPLLVDALGLLRNQIPPSARTALVHGDYRTGNLLFEDDRVTAVLDWEFAALGDPLYDLGWVCCPSNRIGTELVCMLLPEETLLTRYERCTGTTVNRTALRFWVLFHQVRHAVMWLEAGHSFESGATDDLRLARMHYTMPIMRRMVADLLEAA